MPVSERDVGFYAAGGWGYDTDRETHRRFLRQHYMAAFGLEPTVVSRDPVELRRTRLLDAGCGDGFWAGLFHGEGFEVVGIDINEEAVQVAQERHPGPEYLQADARLPLTTGLFDVVFVRAISPTGRPDSKAAAEVMANLAAALVPGGVLLTVRSTDRTGVDSESTFAPGALKANPTISGLVAMHEPHLDVFKVEVVGESVQIGARHWSRA